MKRWFLLVMPLALVLAACGGGGAVVATVDGTDIRLESIEELSPEGGAQTRENFSTNLRNTIVEVMMVEGAAADFDITFDDEAIEARYEELKAEVVPAEVEYEDFLEQQGVTDALVRRVAHSILIQGAVTERLVEEAGPPTDEEVRERFDQQLTSLTEACVSHILSESEEGALAAKARLDSGEDFAEVASAVSTDPSAADNGGDLGCGQLGNYVAEFATGAFEAPIGEVTGPVRSQFGYHLILVGERTEPVFDELRDDIVSAIERERSTTLFNEWLTAKIDAAVVEVDPKYGTWVTDPIPEILPPE
ncbi:MAG: peptidylprolyl isomerase [Acidimicrobiia bacterium]